MNVTRTLHRFARLQSIYRNIRSLRRHFCYFSQSETEINGGTGGLAESLHVDSKIDKAMRFRQAQDQQRFGINKFIKPNLRQAATSILQSSNVKQIKDILDAHLDELDCPVYRLAIEQAARLKNINFCISIIDMMKQQNVTPNVWVFNELFVALAKNDKAHMMPSFCRIMLHEHKIIPNKYIATSLLHGCTASGNTKFAKYILKEVMLPYQLELEQRVYVQLIKIYGKAGKIKKCKQLHTQMLNKGYESDEHANNTLISAYIKNAKIKNALKIKEEVESKGGHLSIAGYSPFIGFYLKNTKHINPHRTLELIEECYRVNNLANYDWMTMEMKFVANLKLLEMNPSSTELFENITTHLPDETERYGNRRWTFGTAGVCFRAHLAYYGQDYDDENVIKCFERFVEMKCLGYWSDGDHTSQNMVDRDVKNVSFILDLHGYSYGEIKFVLHYLFKHKLDELVNEMGYEWTIICGKQKNADPHVKDIGIKQFVMDELRDHYGIRCEVDPKNSGRINLCQSDVREFVQNSLKSDIDLSEFTVAQLKIKCKENGLKMSGRKSELIDRLTTVLWKVPSNETRGGRFAERLKTI